MPDDYFDFAEPKVRAKEFVEVGEVHTVFGARRTVEEVDEDGVWFRDGEGRRGYAPLTCWFAWIYGRQGGD